MSILQNTGSLLAWKGLLHGGDSLVHEVHRYDHGNGTEAERKKNKGVFHALLIPCQVRMILSAGNEILAEDAAQALRQLFALPYPPLGFVMGASGNGHPFGQREDV